MNNYRKTIKKRILLLSIPALLAATLSANDVFFLSDHIRETPVYNFQIGIILSLGILAMVLIIRYRVLLKDESKLLLQFNRENDERIKAIKAKAGIPILPFTSVLIIIAGVIAGYINDLIFVTLISAAVFQMTICAFVKIIYMKKM